MKRLIGMFIFVGVVAMPPVKAYSDTIINDNSIVDISSVRLKIE